MATIEQTWNWNDFSWWEWDWFYYWPPWAYRAWYNIDTRTLENWLKLSNKFEIVSNYEWDIYSVNKFWPKSFFTDYGWWVTYFYYDWVYKFQLSWLTLAHNQIYGSWKMHRTADNKDYLYAFSATDNSIWTYHRIELDFSWATYNIATRTQWLWDTNPIRNNLPTLSLPWRIIWAYWNTIFQIDWAEVITTLVTLPKSCEIINITNFQDTFKVFFNGIKWDNWNTNWYIAYWDWTDYTFQQVVEYSNSPIQNVISDWAVEYAVFGDSYTADLYIIQWLQRSELRINTEGSTWNSRYLWYEWWNREWIIYITWQDKFLADCLYSYWNFFPWTSKSLIPENSWILFNKIWFWNQTIYWYANDAWWTNIWTIYAKSTLFNSTPNAQWFIYSYAMTWNYWLYTEKALKSIYVSYNLYTDTDSIKIYVKKDWWPYSLNSDWRTLLKTITWTDYKAKRWCRISTNEIWAINLWNFYQLEYKVELNAGSTRSPILHWIKTIYDDNLKD